GKACRAPLTPRLMGREELVRPRSGPRSGPPAEFVLVSGHTPRSFPAMLSNWLRRLVSRKPQPLTGGRRSAKRIPTTRLRLEPLEDRLAPALLVWTGDQSNLWGTNNAGNTNWSGDVLPQDGDDLQFPFVALN